MFQKLQFLHRGHDLVIIFKIGKSRFFSSFSSIPVFRIFLSFFSIYKATRDTHSTYGRDYYMIAYFIGLSMF